MKHAVLVVTDSGGIQEETTYLGVPCITVRENTERPVTLSSGTNTIAGTHTQRIRSAIKAQTKTGPRAEAPEKWDGRAGTRIIDRKSTRLNSSHGYISYAVFCLKKKR